MKMIILLLIPLMANGGWIKLEGVFGGPVPCKKVFYQEYQDEYIANINDCSNKTARYYDALRAAGYNPRIAVVLPDPMVPDMLHVVVEVDGKYYDPTNGDKNITDINHFGIFKYWEDEITINYHWEYIRDKQMSALHYELRQLRK